MYRALLLDHVRIASMRDLARVLRVRSREAGAILAMPNGPDCTALSPLAAALARATTRDVYLFAPVKPQAIVFGAPNSPAPWVHSRGVRVEEDGPTFGVGADGCQRFMAGFLSASFGPQEQFGYAAAVGGWIRPSASDDRRSADSAGRALAIESPAKYAASFATQLVEVVDAARGGSDALPLLFIDGRRDCAPVDGTTLDPRLDAMVEDPEWHVIASIPGNRVKMIEASDPSRPGGIGLNRHLVYHTAGLPSQTLSAEQVELAIEGRDAGLNALLASEWQWLPPITPSLEAEESTSVMMFAGHVSDKRTHRCARLAALLSFTGAVSYIIIPFSIDGDSFPELEKPGRHPAAQRAISLAARLHVGPSQWTGDCRRNAHLYTDYFYIGAKQCSVRELAFDVGVNVRMGNIDFPGALGVPHEPSGV
jgi:hypothetical protein